MKVLVIGVLLVALAGCGGSESKPAAAKQPAAPRVQAAEVVYLHRVQGDDPMPYSVSLRADGSITPTRSVPSGTIDN